ncbi:MAG: TetR/AcrR family transcriptional regulator C-terminal domain-containing protein [Gemmatimonadaceae bacterium]
MVARLRLQRGSLSRDAVARAGLDLLDEGSALTMRGVAKRLGATPMSLYAHVADRDDLLDAILSLVLTEVDIPSIDGADWPGLLRAAAESYRTVWLQHGGAITTVIRRPAPHAASEWVRVSEAGYAAFVRAGLSSRDAVFAFRGLHGMVLGLVINELASRSSAPPMVAPDSALAAALDEFAAPDFDATFAAAVDIFIAGIGARVAPRRDR